MLSVRRSGAIGWRRSHSQSIGWAVSSRRAPKVLGYHSSPLIGCTVGVGGKWSIPHPSIRRSTSAARALASAQTCRARVIAPGCLAVARNCCLPRHPLYLFFYALQQVRLGDPEILRSLLEIQGLSRSWRLSIAISRDLSGFRADHIELPKFQRTRIRDAGRRFRYPPKRTVRVGKGIPCRTATASVPSMCVTYHSSAPSP